MLIIYMSRNVSSEMKSLLTSSRVSLSVLVFVNSSTSNTSL